MGGCDRNGRALVTQYDEAEPPVIEVGEVQVLSLADEANLSASWCAETDADGRPNCVYANVGTSPPGIQGGATFTFKGTGSSVCIVTDPEAVFWDQSISPTAPDADYSYPDNPADDGDVDLFAGLSSYYTGSPGVDLGDFKGFYTDSAGNTTEIEYGACSQTGVNDLTNAHAGRGAPERCDVDTTGRAGIEYTVVIQTFSTPPDDGVLSFAAALFDAPCATSRKYGPGVDVTECTLPREALDPVTGEEKPEFAGLESAFCDNKLTEYCCQNPGMCGESPPDGICAAADTAAQ